MFQWGFASLNGLVFLLWKVAFGAKDGDLLSFMSDNFLLNFGNLNRRRWWTYLTSAFSHQSFNHLLPNLLAFNNYVPLALRFGMQPLELVLLSFGSAIAGSAACITHWRKENIYFTSCLGASGVVWGLGMTVTMLGPQTMIVCWPFPRKIQLWMFTLCCFSYDFFSLGVKRSRIGHAAHLGGMAFGAAFCLVRRQIERTRAH
ncbi:hypothetical protein BKA67DRAFT_536396 [Truncatella angustata]|uniref:Peptidase S54 rhomboid domain-containing protein n=1 Tax=Truncatella angustata TaxID=152316 RepID=A0A9P8ZX22_9PEZI|nr:uncharacterized protein BKA67DRAFT_536396 [Truncatella angustata]KAH6652668.1 hypothetical protein BKA67DRAFT_536396 [Truncatella angustata]